ncbi:MAG: hypothetical protein LJE70_18020 [Chromatiaceae bacterium]|jgi:hypothetical protein|nr:hypothetical protein [Chromatiaceae bacterium]
MQESHGHASQDQGVEKNYDKIDRRRALKKMGKYGAYTAPVMLAMLTKDANATYCSPTDSVDSSC